MFDKAIKQLLRQSDPDGVLIPAGFNDSRKLKLLAVVWKKPKTWFFGKDKYSATPFTLNDLLEMGCIKPEWDEEDYLKLNATYKNYGSRSVEVVDEALNVTGLGSSELHFSFDTLRKEYMDIPKLLKDSYGRKVDLSHGLIQQFLKGKLLLTLLKERIFTTCESTIFYSGQEQGSCSSTLKGHSKMMSMKAKGELKRNSDQTITIPAGTVFAYSVIKMRIASDGYIELCFEPDGIESYEAQSLQNELDDKKHFICEVLDLLSEPDNSEQILVAMHMLLSAVEELTYAGLQLLESFCSPKGLRSLQDLVNLPMADSEPLSKDHPSFLTERRRIPQSGQPF